jgi:hypothetical protein
LIAGLGLAAYTLFQFWFPLSRFINRAPPADIRSFTPTLWGGLGYAVWLCLAFALFAFAYRTTSRMERPPSLLFILAATFMFGLPLLRAFPINANDVYRYVIRGRVSSVYDHNPYVSSPADFPNDPFLPLAGEWADATSPYGPLWELSAAALTRLSGDDLDASLLLFKSTGLFLHLAVATLIWLLLAELEPAERIARTLLWAWNPTLLLTFVVDAHNDGLMLFWLLLGFWIMRRGRSLIGFIVMMGAPLTKPIGLLPLPLVFLSLLSLAPDMKSRARFVLGSLIGGVTVVFAAFLPFGSPLDLAQRLLSEVSGGGGFSIQVLILLVARRLGSTVSLSTVTNAALGVFGLVLVWLLWNAWRGRSKMRGTADVFIVYVWQALNFRIWYTVWPFPWLLLDTEGSHLARYRIRVGLWMLLTAQLSVIIYGHLRVHLFARDHLPAHLLGVPFTFALPWILARTNTLFRH